MPSFQVLRGVPTPPPAPLDGTRAHRVSVAIGGLQIGGWLDYEILSTMIEPADGFTLTRPFSLDAWNLCKLDEAIQVAIDGTMILDGFIDDRARDAREGTMEIAGRDKSGRLVQESIPNVGGWDGLLLDDAVRRLAAPWYTATTFSNARNRSVARGKGHKAAAELGRQARGDRGRRWRCPDHRDHRGARRGHAASRGRQPAGGLRRRLQHQGGPRDQPGRHGGDPPRRRRRRAARHPGGPPGAGQLRPEDDAASVGRHRGATSAELGPDAHRDDRAARAVSPVTRPVH